jgi:ANTAR domain
MEPDEMQTAVDDGLSCLDVAFLKHLQIIFETGSVSDTLGQVAKIAVATIEGCDFAGVLLTERVAVTGASQTGLHMDLVDSLQSHKCEGPCLDPKSHQAIFDAVGLEYDDLWPNHAPAASSAGMHNVLAAPLGESGVLNLYARCPASFGDADRVKGALLASFANIALSVARVRETENRRTHNLKVALGTREIIGQAEGILMERERITGDQAFDILRRASQNLNIKLREVAQSLIDTGERPDTGSNL